MNERLLQQLAFVREIDKVKDIFRQTYLFHQKRRENDAEHSWHLAVMALLLQEHAAAKVDVAHVIRMVLIHDLVEIDAGDTYCYDLKGMQDKAEREQRAADRIFAILPPDQCALVRALWEEFEARQTPEAKFAGALDRLQPLMHNYYTEGKSWKEHSIHRDAVVRQNSYIEDGSPLLWQFALSLIDDAVKKGYLQP